ncbi:hypothetical protein JYT29_01635 [Nitrospina gracilis]|nr:hypothetical protein [Nitrospina gracilis]
MGSTSKKTGAGELSEDGISIIENFILKDTLIKINKELDLILSKYSFNGGLFSTKISDWRAKRQLLECTVPGLICSVNIFEIVIDVAEQFKRQFDQFHTEDYVLTSLSIFSEKENPFPLFWHTDNRDGMVRAIIYLKGGKDNSGKFMYMKGTHNRKYYVEHKLSNEKYIELQERVFDCTAPEGSLIIFDSKGFHAKKETIEERRVMMIEFHPRKKQWTKERILLPSNHITEKVIRNINLFANTDFHPEHLGVHNHEVSYQNSKPLYLKTLFPELGRSISHSILRLLKQMFELFSNSIKALRGLGTKNRP